jgi:molybdate transport system ATP-binding protein
MLEIALHKRFGAFELDVAFTMHNGLMVLFGPSGSGKSLTLQVIAGMVEPDAGYICLDGRPVFDSRRRLNVSPQQRRVGYVPQHYALFPHLTVAQNIGFGLTRLTRAARQQRIAELVDLFGLQDLVRQRPRQLSGGQQQRVALARAMAVQPQLLLLDEPFAALDMSLRSALRQELMQVQKRSGITLLMVTHDLDDVYALGQQVIVYDGGRVIQQGSRDEIFFQPANRRVAEFVQTANILPAVVDRTDPGTLWLCWQGQRLAAMPQALAPGSPVYLCIRPSQVFIVRPDRLTARQRENLLEVSVVGEHMHAEMYTLYLRLDDSNAAYDLELLLPAYVYHRLNLADTKRLVVELKRQDIHVMRRQESAAPPA